MAFPFLLTSRLGAFMLRVAIIGASGYTGGELLRLLARHPDIHITVVTSEKSAGTPVDTLFPHLKGALNLKFEALNTETIPQKADFFFLALPHTTSMTPVAQLTGCGKKVVDLSADFRLKDTAAYEHWYKVKHTESKLLGTAVYGLPELNREAIRKASLVANPGCYPTGALLGLVPFIQESLIDLDGIVVDSKSGISGAGRGAALPYHFPEVNESVSAYQVGLHRHQPEIEQEISILADQSVQISFTPHLVPMSRGILTTMYVRMKKNFGPGHGVGLLEKTYKGEPFIHILPSGLWPNTKSVRGSNACHIGITIDPRTRIATIVTAIDNLMKGGSGQAVQNMNLMVGFPETLGLQSPALFP